MFNTEDISRNKSVYQDIFADHTKQKEITHLLSKLIDVRNELLDKNLCKVRDPSISGEVLEDSVNLLDCIVHYFSGKEVSYAIEKIINERWKSPDTINSFDEIRT